MFVGVTLSCDALKDVDSLKKNREIPKKEAYEAFFPQFNILCFD